MNRRQQRVAVLVAVAILLTPAVAPALAAVKTVFVSAGTPVCTQSSVCVKPGSDSQLNLKNPWTASGEVEFKNVTFRGNNAGLTVDNFGDPNNAGTWTNASSVDVSNGVVHIDRAGEDPVGVSGTVSKVSVRQYDLSKGGQHVDVVASASGDWTLYVNNTGLSQGTGVVVKNADTGEALDSAGVGPNGNLVFDELTSVSNADLNLVKGPSELLVFKESNPDQLVKDATLRIRVFGNDQVFEREVTNGKADLTGVPTDKRLTITVKGDADYVYRRITIPSASEQGEVYLINSTSNTNIATVKFRIDDETGGDFPPGSTRFTIEKPIRKDFDGDGTNETQYQIISGDTIGNSGEYIATLEQEERYRLKVSNAQGSTRILGSYVVQGDAAPTVTIGRVVLSNDGEQGYAADLRVLLRDSNGDGTDEQFVRVAFKDPAEKTTNFDYKVVNETSGNTVIDTAVPGPLGTHVQTVQVAKNETAATYRLNWTADRETDNGSTKQISGQRYAGDIPPIGDRLPIDPRWLELIGFVSIVAVGGLVVIVDAGFAGVAATGWASLLTVLGIVAIPAPALGLAGAVSVIAVVGRAR